MKKPTKYTERWISIMEFEGIKEDANRFFKIQFLRDNIIRDEHYYQQKNHARRCIGDLGHMDVKIYVCEGEYDDE